MKGAFLVILFPALVGAGLIFTGGMGVGSAIGRDIGRDIIKDEAVKAGVAQYYLDSNNQRAFRWITNK